MMNTQQQALWDALDAFEKATKQLNKILLEYDEDPNDFITAKYPWNDSFDDVAINLIDWTENAKELIALKTYDEDPTSL